MFVSPILLAACLLPVQLDDGQGTIGGVVAKAADRSPVAGAEVVLRRYIDGSFLPVAESTSDVDGKYYFRNLPTDGGIYQPGANHGGVHYPGEKVRLTPARPVAGVKLEVCDAVAEPCPLVVRRHDVAIEPMEGKLKIREVLQIDNPSPTCYVGKPSEGGGDPVTLELSIPSTFASTTFDKEFYGRRFSLRGGKLVTSIPWTPGQRELGFTYIVPNEKGHYAWQRPLDLPTSQIRIVAHVEDPDSIVCDVGEPSTEADGGVVFLANEALPAGRVIRVEFGRLPIPAITYARWGALALLIAAIIASYALLRKKRTGPAEEPFSPSEHRRRGNRRQRAMSR
jgi:hypothetical protein